MPIHPDVRDQAFRFFMQEAPDHLLTIETELLYLRHDRSRNRVHNLMRAAHSLKGGAGNTGLQTIQAIAHRLEDVFRSFYNEELAINDDLEALLLQGFDCLKMPLETVITHGSGAEDSAAMDIAEAVFVQIEAMLGDYLTTEDQLPTVAEMGIDIAQSIFEVDVAAALERLEFVASHPDPAIVAGELRAQAEVFSGIGELLNFSGFAEMAQLTLKALDLNPLDLHQLYQVALADFRAAQSAVLAGDRQQGGTPSPMLRELAQGSAAELPPADDLDLWDQAAIFSAPDPNPVTAAEMPDLMDVFGNLSEPFTEAEAEPSFQEVSLALEDVFGGLMDNELESLPTEQKLSDPEVGDQELSLLESVFTEVSFFQDNLEPTNDETPSLDSSLTDLEDNFEALPQAEFLLPPSPSSQKPVGSPSVSPASPSTSNTITPSGMSVRLDLLQLERMNNQLGELAINRNKLSLQNEQLQGTLKDLLSRFHQFRGIGNQLRGLLNKLLINPDQRTRQWLQGSVSSLNPGLGVDSASLSGQEFDALELDTYSEIYNLLQTAVDQILHLEETVEDVTLYTDRSSRELEHQRQMLTNLRNELMWARMLPLGDILNQFPRLLRDLSLQHKKGVDLKLSGTSVLVDKAVLEKLYDPLVHLIRNAFDHGIEEAQTRLQQGKPERGTIQIRAFYQGSRTVIEVQDDGRGIDLERVKTKAVELNLITAEEGESLSSHQLLNLLFEPGFSTASKVSELSGRGVGLDIVRAQLQALKGSININSQPGQGTTFTLRIPLTLSISKLLVIWSGKSLVAMPSDSIEEIMIPKADQIKTSGGQHYLYWRNRVIPIYDLQGLLPYNCALPEMIPEQLIGSVPVPQEWAAPLLVLGQGGDLLALRVNRLLTEQELVIKPFSPALTAPNYLYGCTIMGDGNLVPVLDGIALLMRQQNSPHRLRQRIEELPSPVTRSSPHIPTLLIVDDSAGMRQTLSLTLEKAGYRVLQARHGREALDQLKQNPHIRLVICDIEMPVMNGFEFLTQRRQEEELLKTPVVMLTSRSGDKHKRLAMHLGAAHYFTKPYVEQKLLASLQELLQPAALV